MLNKPHPPALEHFAQQQAGNPNLHIKTTELPCQQIAVPMLLSGDRDHVLHWEVGRGNLIPAQKAGHYAQEVPDQWSHIHSLHYLPSHYVKYLDRCTGQKSSYIAEAIQHSEWSRGFQHSGIEINWLAHLVSSTWLFFARHWNTFENFFYMYTPFSNVSYKSS